MKAPQIVVFEFDGWLAKQLRELATDRKWLIKEARQAGAATGFLADGRPTVLFVVVDPHKTPPDGLKFVAEVHRSHPDVSVVVVSDAKLSEDERATWSASVTDLGARFVLFPPLTRPVLEDLAGGLLTAVIQRAGVPVTAGTPARNDVIDLAGEGT